ncbi:MAG: response regulator [Armatimonadetes bacterium]|nr:response regulator [Armatimonadota bacterium]
MDATPSQPEPDEEPARGRDLREPVDRVVGLALRLLDTPLDPLQREYAETLRDSAETLLGLLDELAGTAPGEPGRLAQEPAEDGRPHVLVALANPVGQRLVRRLLERFGCRGDAAADGHAVVQRAAEQAYDVVVIDCRLPDPDGFETALALRRMESGERHAVVVGAVSPDRPGDRDLALAAGMDDCLDLPVHAEELRRVLERWVFRRGPAPVLPVGEPLDPVALRRLEELATDDEPDVADQILRTFSRDLPAQMQALGEAVTAGDPAAVKAAAHKLKGASANLGALRLAALASGESGRFAEGHAHLLHEAERVLEALHRRLGDG